MPPPPHRLTAPLDGRAVFDKAVSWEGLMAGLARVRQNAGSAGGDGVTIDAFAAHAGERIAALSAALRDGSYRPGPLRVAFVDKAGGGSRSSPFPVCATAWRNPRSRKSSRRCSTPRWRTPASAIGRGAASSMRSSASRYCGGKASSGLSTLISTIFDTIPIDALLARSPNPSATARSLICSPYGWNRRPNADVASRRARRSRRCFPISIST